jgi:DNA-binding response OmpR family regulator
VTDSNTPLRVIVVEDDGRMREILVRHLDRLGYRVCSAADAAGALDLMREAPAGVILTDVRMPGMDGRTLLQVVRQRYPDTKVVLMTAFGSVDGAVEAMQAGAYSYVMKPFRVEEIAAVLRNASRETLLARQVERLSRSAQRHYHVDRLIGNSSVMRDVRRQLLEAAALTAPVLITGRSGTGKELAVRAIHHCGSRAAGEWTPRSRMRWCGFSSAPWRCWRSSRSGDGSRRDLRSRRRSRERSRSWSFRAPAPCPWRRPWPGSPGRAPWCGGASRRARRALSTRTLAST